MLSSLALRVSVEDLKLEYKVSIKKKHQTVQEELNENLHRKEYVVKGKELKGKRKTINKVKR